VPLKSLPHRHVRRQALSGSVKSVHKAAKHNEVWNWSLNGTQRKAASNLAKHEISFEEAATVFGDPLGRIVADPRHSSVEERFVLLGVSGEQNLLAVMFVERSSAIRTISARLATRAEQKDYEEGTL